MVLFHRNTHQIHSVKEEITTPNDYSDHELSDNSLEQPVSSSAVSLHENDRTPLLI